MTLEKTVTCYCNICNSVIRFDDAEAITIRWYKLYTESRTPISGEGVFTIDLCKSCKEMYYLPLERIANVKY